ncbi:TrbG/VirB9 family P-type conjugative transfer protein [Gluconobacter cerinus]|uniref:TrbG/VirB9 family P-type conjugative transfer protein n=1 Tax=Gluconobacter cerinus TaxID=38307 RepID=UPI001B8A9B83|nr:TrbG/VirB9 family P-type conjugative transfer protein [Gluconobacter cerinus]MBS0984269.1 TrbG/VirB9 family P-type conjugative transfer protein [Gluconobacter cerinus]
MKKTLTSALVACSFLASPAFATQEPVPSKADARIRTASYTTNDMIHITSTDLNPVQIVLQEGERVDAFAGKLVSSASKEGGTKGAHDWFLIASGNSVVLQPLQTEPRSYLFVNTVAPDGSARHYRFQLDTRKADDAAGSEYEAVNMTYPEVIAAQRRAAWAAASAVRAKKAADEQARQEMALAEWRLKQDRSPQAQGRNWKYDAQNIKEGDNSCEIIGPERNAGVSDDGVTTSLLFAPHTALPVPYILDQDGHESQVQHSQEDTKDGVLMTLHAVAPKIILRRGNRVCGFVNKAYDPIGHQPGTGTVSTNVVREMVK